MVAAYGLIVVFVLLFVFSLTALIVVFISSAVDGNCGGSIDTPGGGKDKEVKWLIAYTSLHCCQPEEVKVKHLHTG